MQRVLSGAVCPGRPASAPPRFLNKLFLACCLLVMVNVGIHDARRVGDDSRNRFDTILMKFPIYRILRSTIKGCLLGMLGGVLWHAAAWASATLEHIELDAGSGILRIDLNQRAQFKVLQLDAREIMVAFKSTTLAAEAAGSLSGSPPVKQVVAEQLPDRVVSLMIETTVDIREVPTQWQNDAATLLVRLVSVDDASAGTIPIKRRRFKKKAVPQTEDVKHSAADQAPDVPPESSPKSRQDPSLEPESAASGQADARISESEPTAPVVKNPGDGSVSGQADARISGPEPTASAAKTPGDGSASDQSDARNSEPKPTASAVKAPGDGSAAEKKEAGLDAFIPALSEGQCAEFPLVADALALCRKSEWKSAFHLLEDGMASTESDSCQADLYYLRAFTVLKMNTAGSDRIYLDAANYFQDALSYYPDVAYLPYALLAMANIYDALGSNAEARGYLNLILKSYADHPAATEALFELGQLYMKEEKHDSAIEVFRRYLAKYPQSPHLTDVRLALGKSLYELNEFADSLDMLGRVIDEDPRRIYEDPDLLVTIGNLNNQLGNLDRAREAMAQAVNLYPESEETPVLLSAIGDSLKESGRKEEAKKIYELVMTMYPDSDGFAVSAIRFADLLEDRAEKEAQYRMVIERFPGHIMAKFAVIRLAHLQYQTGEYTGAIETMRDIMSGNLKELQDDAEYVMASSFDGLFRELADADDLLAIIAAYEKDSILINRFDNPDIFEKVGNAFFQTKFYGQAETLFQKSYKNSTPATRPASLYYRLAVTLQELGKSMQAREMFHQYFQKLSKDEKNPDAYLRMGRLLAAEESWQSALSFIETGIQQSRSDEQKAELLMVQIDVYRAMGKEAQVPGLLVKAINLMASAPEVSSGQLSSAYRRLGESYMALSLFGKATDAFGMALKFSNGNRPPSLLFLLAESNAKAQQPEAAREVLAEIIDSGDAFWARMAKEQLRTMTLEEKIEQQEGGGQGAEVARDQ